MVDPGQLAANLLQKHFSKFGTFRTECSYSSVSNSIYDASSGSVTPVIDSTQTGIFFILAEFSYAQTKAAMQRSDDISILSVDLNAIIPALDLQADPKPDDLLTDDTGTIWKVLAIGLDPKPAHYELHIRPLDHA